AARSAGRRRDDVEGRTRGVSVIGRPLPRVNLDDRGAGAILGFQAAPPLWVACLEPIAQHPGDLDRFRMRTDHASILGSRLAEPEQKTVVDVGKAEAGAFTAAIVHEDLEGRRTVVADVIGDAGELRP